MRVIAGACAYPRGRHAGGILGDEAFSARPDFLGDRSPYTIVPVAGPGERVGDLMQQRLAHLGLIVKRHEVPGYGDRVGREVARAGAASGVVESQVPPGEAVLIKKAQPELTYVIQFHCLPRPDLIDTTQPGARAPLSQETIRACGPRPHLAHEPVDGAPRQEKLFRMSSS